MATRSRPGRCPIFRSIVVVLCLVSVVVGAVAGPALGREKVLRGEAVYYSNRYRGQKMACGGRYQPRKMIAAHRSLPCGTRLRVKNRANGKFVVVTVRDRGPYGDRKTILDLSRRAARLLDYIRAGRAKVRAIVLP
jgi:rare lipoprotein A